MANPGDFTNQARDRLRQMLGGGGMGGATPATGGITPAAFGGASATRAASTAGTGGGRACKDNRDCPPGKQCQGGACVEKSATQPAGGTGGGNACTKNSDCGSNKACINGTCQKPDQSLDGRQCTRGSDCPPGKNCVNGNCVNQGGGGGTTPPEEDAGRDCRRNRQCPPGKVCNQETGKCERPGGGEDEALCGGKKCKDGEVCNAGVCEQPTSAQQCDATTPCPDGETCNGGVCVRPTPDGELADQINANPQVYLANLAGAEVMGSPGLKTGAVTPFGRFLNNRFNDIQNQYEAEALTQSNLDFRDWLRTKSQYGNPYLEMGDGPSVSLPFVDDDNALGAQGRKGNGGDGCNGRCDKKTEKCRRGVCVPKGANDEEDDDLPIASYENLDKVRNIWRNDYYGASAYDRGISPANFGGGSTRWSAW